MAQTPLRSGDPSRVGCFRLSARLGSGAMGVVYLGTAKDGTQAAVKVLRPELADDEEFRVRFRREVMTLTRVSGLCTVRVIEADTDCERPFLATEYAAGPTLAEQLGAAGPCGEDMLLGLAVGLAEALTAIHGAGIIHRDLKPSNVLLTAAGPKVIDFGIAQALDATAVTRTGMVAGSPGFMAPEQLSGQAGQPADIFAWGLTVAFAATGRSPFGTGAADAVLYRIRHEEPDTSEVPEPLRALVGKALSKLPEERPTAADILAALVGQEEQDDLSGDSLTQVLLARTWVLRSGGFSGRGPVGRSSGRDRRRPSRPALLMASVAILVIAVAATAAATLTRTNASRAAGATDTRTVNARPLTKTSSAPGGLVRPSAPPSPLAPAVPGSAPATSSAPTVPGQVYSGDLTCGFETEEGAASVYVTAEHVADCTEISASLATSGAYWNPLTASTVTQDEENGMLPDFASDCHLSNSSGVLISVYTVTGDGQPAGSGSDLGTSICQGEEANGWTPHASTES